MKIWFIDWTISSAMLTSIQFHSIKVSSALIVDCATAVLSICGRDCPIKDSRIMWQVYDNGERVVLCCGSCFKLTTSPTEFHFEEVNLWSCYVVKNIVRFISRAVLLFLLDTENKLHHIVTVVLGYSLSACSNSHDFCYWFGANPVSLACWLVCMLQFY
jgi:hypothetical protein